MSNPWYLSVTETKKSLEQVYTHIYIYTQAIYKKVATEPFSLNEKKMFKKRNVNLDGKKYDGNVLKVLT